MTKQYTAERQRFLTEASTLLAESIEYEVRLTELVRLTVPHIADWCVINILTESMAIESVAWAPGHMEKAQLVAQLYQHYPLDRLAPCGTPHVIRTGQPELYPVISEDLLIQLAQTETERDHWHTLGCHSMMIIPFMRHGHAIGAFTLVIADSERYYTVDDLALAEDLAQRAAVVIENARLYRDMQEAVQTRDAFLLIASHELKTPLTALLGQAQLLQRRIGLNNTTNERDQRAIRVIVEQAQRLNKLVTSLLDVSRLSQSQLGIVCTPFNVSALVQQTVRDFLLRVEQHTLICDVPEQPVMINGDALRLEQVFQNLIQNAIKYSPQGGQVTVRVEQQVNQAVVRISDQGIGIPAGAIAHLFQRFYRVNNASAQNMSGIGIGLYVVREIITLHEGNVFVESTEGQGSTFTITLPIIQQNNDHHLKPS